MPAGWVLAVVGAVAVLALVGVLLRRKSGSPAGPIETRAVAPADSVQRNERRQASRRPEAPIAIHVAPLELPGDPVEGWVVNRSPGGLCLSLHREVAPATVLHARLANHPTMAWVPLEVKYCGAFASRWKVGCQFVQPDSADAQLLLYG